MLLYVYGHWAIQRERKFWGENLSIIKIFSDFFFILDPHDDHYIILQGSNTSYLPIWDVLQKSFLSFCRRWNLVLFSFSRFSFWNLVFFHRSYLTALQGLFSFCRYNFFLLKIYPTWSGVVFEKKVFFCKRSTWQEPRALRLAFLWPDSPAAINWLINW